MTSAWQPVGLSGGGGMFTPAISPHEPGLILINCDMSGSYRSDDGGRSWSLIPWHQLTGCPFCAPAFHPAKPEVVFAAHSYAATLRVSRDRGQSWSPVGTGLPGDLRAIAIDPQHPERMIVGGKHGIFRSLDAGGSWTKVFEPGPEREPTHVAFDRAPAPADRRIVLVASRHSMHRSDDGGTTWRDVTPALSGGASERIASIVAFASVHDASAGRLTAYAWAYSAAALEAKAPAMATTHLLRSDDAGASWELASTIELPAGWATGGHHFLLACDADPRRLYAVLPLNLPTGTVRRSDDRGRTWRSIANTDKSDPGFNQPVDYCSAYFLPRSIVGWAICNAFIDPRNPDRLAFAHYCHLHETRDGGRTWQGLDVRVAPGHPPMGEHTLLPRFEWISTGLVVTTTWNYYVDPFDRDRHTIAYTDLGMAQSTNAGRTWVWRRETGPNTYEMAWDPDVKGRVWAALSSVHDIPNNNIVLGGHWHGGGTGCVGYSEDHGQTWSGRNAGLPGGDDSSRAYDWSIPTMADAPVTSIVLDPRSPRDRRRLFASLFERGVFRSDDGGLSWRSASRGLGHVGESPNLRACRLKIHADGSLFCVVTGNLVEGRLARPGVGLFRSDDAGDSWRDLTAALDLRWACDFDVDPRDSRVIYLGVCDDSTAGREDGGLFKTENGGGTWRRIARKSSRHFGATVDPDRPEIVYMTLNYNDAKEPALWISRDAGKNWSPIEGFPFCSVHRVAFDPFDAGVIYVTTYGASVWRGPRVR